MIQATDYRLPTSGRLATRGFIPQFRSPYVHHSYRSRVGVEWFVEDFRRAGHEVIDWIAHPLEHTRDYPVLPKVQPGELTGALPRSGTEAR